MTSDSVDWLVEHNWELFQKYRGRWIAVWKDRVIGVGDTAPEAAAQAEREAPGEPYVLQAFDHETDVI